MDDHEREMIATLAKELMGWSILAWPPGIDARGFSFTPSGVPVVLRPRMGPTIWNPLGDWRAAGEIIARMDELRPTGPGFNLIFTAHASPPWLATFGCNNYRRPIAGDLRRVHVRVEAEADTGPRAIAMAAYAALKERPA